MFRNAMTCALVLAVCGAAQADDKFTNAQGSHLLKDETGRATDSTSPFVDAGGLMQVPINLTGSEFIDPEGDPLNVVSLVNLPPNAHIVALGWDTCQVAYSPSWLSEMVIKLSDSSQSEFVHLTPGIGDSFPGTSSYSSGGLTDLVGLGFDFNVGADGVLRLELYESFDDFPDAADGQFCGPGAIETIITVAYVTDSACECYWDNGAALAKFDGQQSFINGYLYPDDPRGHEESRVADDFYLEKGYQYLGVSFGFSMITTFEPVPNSGDEYYDRVIVELYEDCDGRPAEEPFAVLTDENSEIGLLDTPVPLGDGSGAYLSHWYASPLDEPLCLEGNKQYWISAIGINEYFDEERRWYFAAAPEEPIRCAMSVARDDIADTVLQDEWTPSARINLHCQELAFCVNANQCPIVCDNGDFDYDGVPSIMDTTVPEARAADNFVLNPCYDYQLCYLEGYVATNCNPWNAIAEIYTNVCDPESEVDEGDQPGDEPYELVSSFQVTKVIDTGETVELGGKVLRIYCLQFCVEATREEAADPLHLPGNQNYWVSIVNRGTGSFNERAFSLFNVDCRRECQIKISQAQFISPGAGYPDWVRVEKISALGPRDLSFKVGATAWVDDAQPVTACWVDINGDGVVNTLDVGAFLNAYGQGCLQN